MYVGASKNLLQVEDSYNKGTILLLPANDAPLISSRSLGHLQLSQDQPEHICTVAARNTPR